MPKGIDEIFEMLFGKPANSMNDAVRNTKRIWGYYGDDEYEMGTMCAQLGLTPEDVPKMARAYRALQMFDGLDVELNYLAKVIRDVQRD